MRCHPVDIGGLHEERCEGEAVGRSRQEYARMRRYSWDDLWCGLGSLRSVDLKGTWDYLASSAQVLNNESCGNATATAYQRNHNRPHSIEDAIAFSSGALLILAFYAFVVARQSPRPLVGEVAENRLLFGIENAVYVAELLEESVHILCFGALGARSKYLLAFGLRRFVEDPELSRLELAQGVDQPDAVVSPDPAGVLIHELFETCSHPVTSAPAPIRRFYHREAGVVA